MTTPEGGFEQSRPVRQPHNPLPIDVRRATSADRDAIVRFANTTPDGPDYIPDAFLPWLAENPSIALVATVAPGAIASDRPPLCVGTPVAFARIAMLSDDEAWLDCIRVAPEVRGRGVGTLLQVAELNWCRALGARTVRYATAESNTLSHRLGGGHGFERLGNLRSYGRFELEDGIQDTRRRPGLGSRTGEPGRIARLWGSITRDKTFLRNSGLYEWRSWALQQLTLRRFADHVAAGDVIVGPDENAVAVLSSVGRWASERDDHLAMLIGDGKSALLLLAAIEKAIGRRPRLRLPDPSPPILGDGAEENWLATGYGPHVAALHLLEKRLTGPSSTPEVPAELLRLIDIPPTERH